MDNLPFFGIYTDDINHAMNICDDEMYRIGMSDDDISDVADDAKDHINEVLACCDNPLDNITNIFIDEYFRAAEYAIKEKYPNKIISYYTNGWASSFDVEDEDEEDKDEED